jgi:hypothetical protein
MGTADGSGGETLNCPPRRLRHAAVEIWGNAVIWLEQQTNNKEKSAAKTDRSTSYIVDKAIRKMLKLSARRADKQQ